MNVLELIWEGSFWQEQAIRLSLTLLHFIWQGLLVGLVAAIALQCCKRKSANCRYWVACGAFFCLPLLAVSTFSLVEVPTEFSSAVARENAADNVGLISNDTSEAWTAVGTLEESGVPVPRVVESEYVGAGDVAATLPLAEFAGGKIIPSASTVQAIYPFLPLIAASYLAGVLLMLVRLQIKIWRGARLCSRSPEATDQTLLVLMKKLARQAGLKFVPVIRYCDRVVVPTVVGILKPVVLMPASLVSQLTVDELTAIVNHELAHIRRFDPVVQVVQKAVEALLFFHPVTWWISRRIRIERENCCDDMASKETGPLPYAAALLKIAELCLGNDPERSTMLAGLSADGQNTTEFAFRIRRLIGADDAPSVGLPRRGFYVLLAIGLVTSVSFAANMSLEKESMSGNFMPAPAWQTEIGLQAGSGESKRFSPVVVAENRILTRGLDFDRNTGKPIVKPLERSDKFDPVHRRKSADRQFIVEIGRRIHVERTRQLPSFVMRVLSAADGQQVGATIKIADTSLGPLAVDVERGGDFVMLAGGSDNEPGKKIVRVYSVRTGAVETTLPVETERIDAVAFSPDREWLVISDQNRLHFWQWRDQAPVKTIKVGRKIDSLTFTADGQYLVEGPDSRKDIQIRDMRTLEVIASLRDEVESPLLISSMDVTPDGRYLVAHNEVMVDPTKLKIPHRIHLWDLRTRKPVFQIATDQSVRNVAFSDDGRQIIGEFAGGSNNKAILAAWQIPLELVNHEIESPTDANDRLGDGIHWSLWGDKDGLLSGVRIVSPSAGLARDEPLVVEYRLANVSGETKTIRLLANKGMRFASLSSGNRIGGFGIGHSDEPDSITLEPGDVHVAKELVSIDTTGLQPGNYSAALGAAFYYPNEVKKSVTHSIPHRGSVPFKILGKPTVENRELPKSDIQWGKPVAGLKFGAKWKSGFSAFTIDSTVEADLFVANVTTKPVTCDVEMPHPADGWLTNIKNPDGSNVALERQMFRSQLGIPQFIPLQLAPGEIAQITGEGVKVSMVQNSEDENASPTSVPTAKFQVVYSKDAPIKRFPGDLSPRPNLVTRGGRFLAIFGVTLHRPDIPNLRLNLSSARVRFSPIGPGSRMAPPWFDDAESIESADPEAVKPEMENLHSKVLGENSLARKVDAFNERIRLQERSSGQPLLTAEEVLTAIKNFNREKNERDVNDQEVACFKAITSAGELPETARFQVYTGRHSAPYVVERTWDIRLLLPAIGHDGFVRFKIRDTKLPDETINPKEVAWGDSDEDGLELGIYLSPRKAAYQFGERVRMRLLVRNRGDQPVKTVWANTTHPMPDDFTVTDANGNRVDVFCSNEDNWTLPWISGFMGSGIAPGDTHALYVPYEIRIGLNGIEPKGKYYDEPNDLVGRAIDARAGQQLKLQIQATNGNYQTEQNTIRKSGSLTFNVSAPVRAKEAEPSPDSESQNVIWSKKNRNGLVAGAKLLRATEELNPGDPIVVQFLLKNESREEQTIILQELGNTHPTLGSDNRLELNVTGSSQASYQHTLKPGEVLEARQYRATVITTGMPEGNYHITAGSAFWIAKKGKSNQATGVPFGRKIPFALGDPDLVKLKQPPADENVETKIYWGKPSGNLILGMRVPKGRQTWPADKSTVEGQLFLFNAGDKDVELNCELPSNPADWNLHVTSRDNSKHVRLDSVWFTGLEPSRTRTMRIPAGEHVAVTGVKAEINTDGKVATELIQGPTLQVIEEKTEFKYGAPKRLIDQQGRFSFHAAITIHPAGMLDSVVVASAAPVPFTIEAD